ncbi:MAG: flagellar biosynthesis protein FlhB [Candidatus Kapabacteria bacterium]|nr:flagellar biosynthesis protein FlhB [Candidatus Kapabacteria bacterium]
MAQNKEGQEKSEPASAKRLLEARLKGQVAKSHDVTTAAVLLIGGYAIYFFGKPMIAQIQDFMKFMFRRAASLEVNYENVMKYYPDLILFLAKATLPLMFAIFVIVLISEVSQVGLKVAWKKFGENSNMMSVFNPFTGIKKMMFSSRSAFELLKSIMKIIIITAVVYWVLHKYFNDTVDLVERPFSDIAVFMAQISFELISKVSAVFIIIAVADYYFQKRKFRDDMKMTKQEVKEESKQAEGDPKIKARIRQLMRQKLRRLMMQNVKKADVVITNPTHFAVALKYDPETMNAPKVIAKGVDFLALRIKEIAAENDIPMVEDRPLARMLYFNAEVDQEIPETVFKAVATILAYVYHLKKKEFVRR